MDCRIISFNRAAENFTGFSRGEVLGRYCWEVLQPSSNKCETNCPLKKTTETCSPVMNKVVATTNATGKKVYLSIYDVVLKDNNDQVIGMVKISRDLSLVEELRKELSGRYTFADIISKNHRMQQIFQILPDIAESESNVLIEGPTGSGKELLARAIHKYLPKSNCRQCQIPTCLAFAAAVINGQKSLGDCPHLDNNITERFDIKLYKRVTREQQQEQFLEQLKREIAIIDFYSSAERLGASLSGEKLKIKCLGKD